MSQKKLQNKWYKFVKLTEEKKTQLLEYHPELASHGGFRKENIKVSQMEGSVGSKKRKQQEEKKKKKKIFFFIFYFLTSSC